MAYATRAQFYAYLQQLSTAADIDTDALVDDVLARASDMVRSIMRVALADPTFDYGPYPAPAPRVVRGYGGAWLFLPAHQPGSVSAVAHTVSGAPLLGDWSEEATVTALYRAASWGATDYTVTAAWGYGPDVPPAIVEVTLELAVNIWRSRDKAMFTDVIGVDGGGGVQYIGGVTNQQRMALTTVAASYRQQRGMAL